MNALYDWNIFTDKGGYLYCEGMLNGRGWITSSIQEMKTYSNYYVIYTENSIYYLY